jgi:3-deoxy-D-manno-octulosonate 8-phosphate phosphatase (KDO 8-P phosphatase)
LILPASATRIRLVLLDVDGVLTDGRVLVHSDGTESKFFAIRDGISLVWAQRAGLRIGLLSARSSLTTLHRAAQLGISLIHQGVSNKLSTYERILADTGLTDAEVAYMGDDIVDLAVLARAGFSAAPSDAVAEVRSRVDWVSRYPGGSGAVRELIEDLLRAQNRWEAIVSSYAQEPTEPEATAAARPSTGEP